MKVLQSSLYPGASPASIKMVLGYCKAAGLDPMQKPVHIVPMWDAKAGAMRDVVMPGVNLYRTQAARSNRFAGMSEPEFGPDETATLGGQEITFPVWCRVTVKRELDSGAIAEFTAREFWMENYAVKGGKEKSIAPNAMWMKRPKGQIAKCAAAQALRIAFPEIASAPTADEMEGKQVYPDDAPPPPPPPPAAPIQWPDEAFSARLPKWKEALASGQTVDAVIAFAKSKGALSQAQEQAIRDLAAPPAEPTFGDDTGGAA
jgi:phage recombination protein Bet